MPKIVRFRGKCTLMTTNPVRVRYWSDTQVMMRLGGSGAWSALKGTGNVEIVVGSDPPSPPPSVPNLPQWSDTDPWPSYGTGPNLEVTLKSCDDVDVELLAADSILHPGMGQVEHLRLEAPDNLPVAVTNQGLLPFGPSQIQAANVVEFDDDANAGMSRNPDTGGPHEPDFKPIGRRADQPIEPPRPPPRKIPERELKEVADRPPIQKQTGSGGSES